jgi:hypothetical protein
VVHRIFLVDWDSSSEYKSDLNGFLFSLTITSVHWDSSSEYKSDPNAFLFSLTNKDNQPSKMKQIKTTNSICCRSCYGPSFGGGADLFICNSANTTVGSISNLGHSYRHPQPEQGESYLAGSYQFQLSEIEVYQKDIC